MEHMSILSNPSVSGTGESNSLDSHQNEQVGNILQQHETALKQSVAPMFAPVVNEMPSPSSIFKDYIHTGEPMLKEAAGHALNVLQDAAKNFNTNVNKVPGEIGSIENTVMPPPKTVGEAKSMVGVIPIGVDMSQPDNTPIPAGTKFLGVPFAGIENVGKDVLSSVEPKIVGAFDDLFQRDFNDWKLRGKSVPNKHPSNLLGSYANNVFEAQGRQDLAAKWEPINSAQVEWNNKGTETARAKLLARFSTKTGQEILSNIVDQIPRNPDGTITAYRTGKIVPGQAQSYTVSKGMAATFSHQGTDALPSWVSSRMNGGKPYDTFGKIGANEVRIDPKHIVAWSPYDAEILATKSSKIGTLKNVLRDAPATPSIFTGFKNLTTQVLDQLKGKATVSKQFISDLTNQGGLKQAERDLIRTKLADYPDTVPVKEFANDVKTELLPLKMSSLSDESSAGPRYESISLPESLRGHVANYDEHVYQSPIRTSAGDVHFSDYTDAGQLNKYFAHTRIEDLPTGETTKADLNAAKKSGNTSVYQESLKRNPAGTRRIIELQSDLFQKDRYKESILNLNEDEAQIINELATKKADVESATRDNSKYLPDYKKELKTAQKAYDTELKNNPDFAKYVSKYQDTVSKLEPYRNTWWQRIIPEEVKQAAKDGKTKLQFPVGDTAMKIEGLGGDDGWTEIYHDGDLNPTNGQRTLRQNSIETGMMVTPNAQPGRWVVTEVLGSGKFKAAPMGFFEDNYGQMPLNEGIKEYNRIDSSQSEQFDISGKMDTSNPIHKFYEKDVGKFLQSKYGAKRITDPQGVDWWEMDVPKASKNQPIRAFGKAPVGSIFGGAAAGIGTIGAAKLGQSILKPDATYDRTDQIEKSIPQSVSSSSKELIYDAGNHYGVTPSLLAEQLKRENAPEDPKAVRHNSNGTKDLGLMQINSSMIPFITNEFAKMGKKFDWKKASDSIEAAAILHNQNKNVLKNYGVSASDKNLFDAYNVGPRSVFKALQGDKTATSAVSRYNRGTIFGK